MLDIRHSDICLKRNKKNIVSKRYEIRKIKMENNYDAYCDNHPDHMELF